VQTHKSTSTQSTSTKSTSTPTKSTRTTTSPPGSFYVVRSGDTLDAIAARYGLTLQALEALNPGVLSNALHVGQRLTLKR
jgi:LysM repeat protein